MLTIETRAGDSIPCGELSLVPIARSVRLDLGRGAWVQWNRAVGLAVESSQRRTVVPIRDRTRQMQLAVLGAGLLGSLFLWLAARRRGG